MSLLRVRFHVNPNDPRPLYFPVEHPYWISGQGGDYSIVVSYANNLEYIKENWPEANNIEIQEVDGYVFTDRFQKPVWWELIQLRSEVARLAARAEAAEARANKAEAYAKKLEEKIPETNLALAQTSLRAEAAEAKVAALTAALAAANEDAERLAERYDVGKCIHCGCETWNLDKSPHRADCPITLHRARVGGGS